MLKTSDLAQSIHFAGMKFVVESFVRNNAPIAEILEVSLSTELAKITNFVEVDGRIYKIKKSN